MNKERPTSAALFFCPGVGTGFKPGSDSRVTLSQNPRGSRAYRSHESQLGSRRACSAAEAPNCLVVVVPNGVRDTTGNPTWDYQQQLAPSFSEPERQPGAFPKLGCGSGFYPRGLASRLDQASHDSRGERPGPQRHSWNSQLSHVGFHPRKTNWTNPILSAILKKVATQPGKLTHDTWVRIPLAPLEL